jgi:signal transduction histidine kinase
LAIRSTFRLKLFAIVGTAALALVVLIATGALLSQRVSRQLAQIQKVYVPKIELGPKLEAHLEAISRGLQDAVAAHEVDAIAQTRVHKDALLHELALAVGVVEPGKAAALTVAIEEYYGVAQQVSERIVAGEKGEALVEAITSMQVKQRRAAELLKEATSFNRGELTEVFSSAAEAQETANRLRLIVSVLALALVMLLSFLLGSGALRSLAALTSGFERFGRGDFGAPIAVTSQDELGDVAQQANRMARDLQQLAAQRDKTIQELDASRKDLAVALEATKITLAELEAFSYSVSHDLRAPLRGIDGFSQALLDDHLESLDEEGKQYLRRIRAGAQRMGQLIDDLLKLSKVTRSELRPTRVDLSQIAREVAEGLQQQDAARRVDLMVKEGLVARGDPRLLRVALENLLGNAWKFTSKLPSARIELGQKDADGRQVFFVRDNGAGFDMEYAEKLFGAFQRLHAMTEFPGTGIGLATVQRVIHRHGGKVWAEGAVGQGATFYFTLQG